MHKENKTKITPPERPFLTYVLAMIVICNNHFESGVLIETTTKQKKLIITRKQELLLL